MAAKKSRIDPEDDGRTIARMDLDGMPWTLRRPERPETPEGEKTPMTKQEMRLYTWAAVKAGLAIALVFGLVYFLFIFFCTQVWFA